MDGEESKFIGTYMHHLIFFDFDNSNTSLDESMLSNNNASSNNKNPVSNKKILSSPSMSPESSVEESVAESSLSGMPSPSESDEGKVLVKKSTGNVKKEEINSNNLNSNILISNAFKNTKFAKSSTIRKHLTFKTSVSALNYYKGEVIVGLANGKIMLLQDPPLYAKQEILYIPQRTENKTVFKVCQRREGPVHLISRDSDRFFAFAIQDSIVVMQKLPEGFDYDGFSMSSNKGSTNDMDVDDNKSIISNNSTNITSKKKKSKNPKSYVPVL